MISNFLQTTTCSDEFSSLVKSCNQSIKQQQIINDDEIYVPSQTNIEDIQKQNCFSWNEGVTGYSTRTTASNSTEMYLGAQTLNNQSELIGNINNQIKCENIPDQNIVFCLEEVSLTPRSKSEDLTPFLNLSQKNKSNSNILKQSQEQNINKVNFKMNLQNNTQDEFDNLQLHGEIKSENFIPQSQNEKENIKEQLKMTTHILEEIKKINMQENEDEIASPTLKLRRVKPETDNSIEERIYIWLDIQGIKQVDPSQKREQYYQTKRESLISMKKHSKPLNEELKQASGSLNICKISSSPLFNRRKQNNPQPLKKKNFVEIHSDSDFQSSNPIQDIKKEESDQQSTLKQQNQIDNQISQLLNANTQQKQIPLTKNMQERIESPEMQNLLKISQNNKFISHDANLQDSQHKNEEVDIQYFQNEEKSINDKDVNNILHGQEIKLFHKLSLKTTSQTTSDNNNSCVQSQGSTITKQQNQENYDFINKKLAPNLEIHKNQKRLSLKHQNSRAQLSNN